MKNAIIFLATASFVILMTKLIDRYDIWHKQYGLFASIVSLSIILYLMPKLLNKIIQ